MEERDQACIFCEAHQKMPDDQENLIVHRGQRAFVILNRYPYTSGHLMVVPYEHRPSLEDIDAETRGEMMELVTKCILVLRNAYHPQGFNVGANIGDAAGAGIPKHFHLHVVPRWSGDTNFMSALGVTRVIPESLSVTYLRICSSWKDLLEEE